jgi:hypothetical protein
MKDQTELESEIQEWLDEIKPVPPRNPQAAARGRAQFLAQAVSASEVRRHKGWISIFRKERFAMNMLVSILVIAGLLFGGGATVNAAQNDLPNEPLYALKLWSEDLGLQFQNEPEQKVERLMDLAQVRLQEMTQLAITSQPVPDQLRQRLQLHLQQALQICATQDDPAMDRTLLQIRDRLQQQDHDMEQIQLHAAQDVQPALQQTRTMLQQRLQLVDEGLLDHETFRYAVRNGFQFGQEQEIVPPVQNGLGPQNGQPTSVPAGPNSNPGGPNTNPTGAGDGTGEPNPDRSGPNNHPGGPNTSATPSSPAGGGGAGGNNNGEGGSGGDGTGGSGSNSGSGTGGGDSGGGDGGGSGSGGGTGGGGGSGGN